TMADLANVAKETRHVSHALDFGKHTARGVLGAIKAAVKFRLGLNNVREVRVAIQGLGSVGMELASQLHRAGARLVVADTQRKLTQFARKRFEADVVSPERIMQEPCDVFAPCALGDILSPATVKKLSCEIIAGSANNVLTDSAVAQDLAEEGIAYVPDFVASAGALIIGATEIAHGKARARAELADSVYDTTLDVLRTAKKRGISTLQAAETIAAKALNR
ncbi:MAG: Glu/Leu/Phe/Val dehydrogenase family protein, partial [Planctomycetes bacterium]|nr:Glu/Leu/Phe/Val dehydrogenase family protein [Planctomycetota bacterium]